MPIPVTGQPKPTPTPPARDGRLASAEAERLRRERERDIDEELEQSFPASDPPSWTMGVTPADESTPSKNDVNADNVPTPRAPTDGSSQR
jgi:hypothetical protein